MKDLYSVASKVKLQSEIGKGVEAWRPLKVVESAHSIIVKDFVLVNIDTEEKLVIVLLASESIRK